MRRSAERGGDLEARRGAAAVVVERGRKFQDAERAVFLRQKVEVGAQGVRFRQAGRHGQDERRAARGGMEGQQRGGEGGGGT